MVSNITSMTGHGLRDWLVQRVTAVILAVYTIFMVVFFLRHPNLDYNSWKTLFSCNLIRISTVITLLALMWHAWIGLWTVSTDYLKCLALRLSFQVIVFLALLTYVVWGIVILWSV